LTESASRPVERGPLHGVTRLERVLQQIRSFTTLHAAELDGLAAELQAAGQADLAARLQIFLGLHAQEAELILDELADLRGDLDREAESAGESPTVPEVSAGDATPGRSGIDPAANSAKRARWLAEQARQAEEARRPRSRRDLFRRG
jgi:hypothetical protein